VSERPRGPGRPPDRRRAADEPTPASPVEALLTPPDSASGEGEPTEGLPVHLATLADGRYVLGRQLGAGGMGIVRAAYDEVLHREVAVKLLADNLAADHEARERFLREARAAARIHDPHVVTVHDVGDEAGRPYLVMELVDGPSLADVLATRGTFDPHEVIEVAAQALAGIARAHDAGLLHRDVKPGNLLRHPDGTLKVTDFGVAEAADTPGLTRTGFVIGTRSYLAPERRRGRPADARTDLYALGATLVELLTGQPPADDAGFVLPDDTPHGLTRLVEQLLAEDPDERPISAEAALEALMGSGTTTAEEAAGAIDDEAAVATAALARHTAVLAAELSPPAHPVDPDTPSADPSGPSSGRDPDPASDGSAGPVIAWRTVVVIGVALLAIVVVFQLATAGDDLTAEPAPVGGEEVEAGTDVEPVERVEDDPETTARNLADWIREHSADE
jgi:eukaryotic-like serine/threonine-protein kinase